MIMLQIVYGEKIRQISCEEFEVDHNCRIANVPANEDEVVAWPEYQDKGGHPHPDGFRDIELLVNPQMCDKVQATPDGRASVLLLTIGEKIFAVGGCVYVLNDRGDTMYTITPN